MPILVKGDDDRSGRKAKARHGRLRVAQELMGNISISILSVLTFPILPTSGLGT